MQPSTFFARLRRTQAAPVEGAAAEQIRTLCAQVDRLALQGQRQSERLEKAEREAAGLREENARLRTENEKQKSTIQKLEQLRRAPTQTQGRSSAV